MIKAEELALKQREISVSEFFTKNRHLLGFDSPAKAILMAVKECVDNSLDATEEMRVLPDIYVEVKQLSENRLKIIIEDNGPGIVKKQIPHIFARLLYGSKFFSMRQQRGQQGIGICMAPDTLIPTGNGKVLPIKEIVEMICRKLGVSFESAVEIVEERTGQDSAYVVNSEKSRRELDWKPEIPIEKGIDDNADGGWKYYLDTTKFGNGVYTIFIGSTYEGAHDENPWLDDASTQLVINN